MIRFLVSLLLVACFLGLFLGALALHTLDRTVLDRAFAREAVPTLLASGADIAAVGIAATLKGEHGVLVDLAKVRDAFRATVTDGTVEALVDDFYRQVDLIAETGHARLDLPLAPLSAALQAFHDRLMRDVVRPALPKELPAGALAALDRDVSGFAPARLSFNLGPLSAAPLSALRFHMRNRSLVDALAFALAALPLLLLFPLHAGRAGSALRWSGFALLAAAAGIAFARFGLHLAFAFPDVRFFMRPLGLAGLLDPLSTSVALFLRPAARIGYGCLFLGLFAWTVAAHPKDDQGEGTREPEAEARGR